MGVGGFAGMGFGGFPWGFTQDSVGLYAQNLPVVVAVRRRRSAVFLVNFSLAPFTELTVAGLRRQL